MEQIFSSKPYQKDGAYSLIQAAKVLNISYVHDLLIHNKYLVYDFDESHRTPLHWAAIKGSVALTRLLLDYNSDLEFQDLYKKKALYYAVKGGHREIVKRFLYHGADPWTTDDERYYDLTNDLQIAEMLRRCRQFALILKAVHPRKRDEIWATAREKFLEEFPLEETK